jgi:nitroreductase
MELDACIKGRRSIRSYQSKPVSPEMIDQILEAGTWAPTGMATEPWRFVIIENKELIRYVSDETKKILGKMDYPMAQRIALTKEDTICYNAPVLILICTEKDEQHPMNEHVRLLDSVLAAENMFLKAYELGLGTCYMGFVSALTENPTVMKKLGVPDNCRMMVPFILGYPKAKPPQKTRQKPQIVQWSK